MEKLKTIIIDAALDAALEEHYVLFDHSTDLPESADSIAVGLAEELPFTPEEYQQTLEVVSGNFLLTGQSVIKTLKNPDNSGLV